MSSQGPCWNQSAADEAPLWEILIDVCNSAECASLLCGYQFVCIVQVWWSPKLPQWLMHGIPLRPVVLPVWGLCGPLRGLSTSSRLRLSTERSDWLRERWRPLPKGGWGKAGREEGAGVSNHSSFILMAYILGHNRDVIGHPEQHQPNLGLLLCCWFKCAVIVCSAALMFLPAYGNVFGVFFLMPLTAWLTGKTH